MKPNSILGLFFSVSALLAFTAPDPRISTKDLKNLAGCWSGTLTYLDYSTNKPLSMPANIIVPDFKNNHDIVFSYIYPREPHANSTDTIFISRDGKLINQEKIQSLKRYTSDSIEITSIGKGSDGNDNKAAFFRHRYILGKNSYSTTKEVRFTGQAEWILRNKYAFVRVKPCR